MKLRGKHLVTFAVLGMVILTVVQWWSYQQVGEILEKYPATSVTAQYRTNISPILPSLYVRSLGKSLVGYYYLPSSREYVLLVRGREGKPNGDYLREFQRLQDSYTDYFNLTSKYIRLWSETGDKSAFQLAVFMLENTAETGAELKALTRGENVTEVLVEPPYPYRLLSGWAPLLESFAVLLLLIAGAALLVSRLDALIGVFSNFRNLALLLVLLIGVSAVAYGLLHERPDPLMGVHSNWSNSLNSCGASVYYLHRNTAADSILLDAAGSAKYVEVSKVDGRVRRVALALSPEREEALLHSLSRAGALHVLRPLAGGEAEAGESRDAGG